MIAWRAPRNGTLSHLDVSWFANNNQVVTISTSVTVYVAPNPVGGDPSTNPFVFAATPLTVSAALNGIGSVFRSNSDRTDVVAVNEGDLVALVLTTGTGATGNNNLDLMAGIRFD
jgi:hypothetical protein